ncbi:virB8 family protein [Neorhizobium sp. T786]|uniref:virB8 family protein n=1 Tax=Pseudorhizobium xiangyangii TaxID=2883104 RepID=UPI001CFFAF51|nr:VirB8/TrbF family protein [Neorhizobium xiangyangii]MCB5205168.1 virB8 family protein [Neorhizobium xiangyangii]
MVTEDALKDYFERSRKWERDAYIDVLRSRRIWRLLALTTSALAIAGVGAVAALAPLKSVEPFVIRVDNSTGIVETMSALTDAPGKYDEAISRHFLHTYLRAREGFLFDEAKHNFRVVSLMSSSAEQERFGTEYSGNNPDSPQNRYGRHSVVEVAIKSVSFIADTAGQGSIAQVRYLRTERRDKAVQTSHWIATVSFQYVGSQFSSNDRLVNPLGFIVTEYRTAEEGASN